MGGMKDNRDVMGGEEISKSTIGGKTSSRE
jgi:hypothetical protein